MPTFRIAVLGDLNSDLLLTVAGYPGIGGEALASHQRTQVGGSASNTAIVLQRLNAQARLIACVGNDAAGDAAVAALEGMGIDTRSIARSLVEPTSTNVVILTPGGDRTMFAYRGASAVLDAESVTDTTLEGTDWLHVSGYALLQDPQRGAALRAIELASAAGIPISLDVPTAQWTHAGASIPDVAAHLTLLAISETGAHAIMGDPLGLLEAGCRVLALKRGEHGCRIVTRDEDVSVPAAAADVVDTTGAGDSFAAGAILAVLQGADAATIGQRANRAGARAASTHGAGQALWAT